MIFVHGRLPLFLNVSSLESEQPSICFTSLFFKYWQEACCWFPKSCSILFKISSFTAINSSVVTIPVMCMCIYYKYQVDGQKSGFSKIFFYRKKDAHW